VSETSSAHVIRQGLDLPMTGKAEQKICHGAAIRSAALVADDYPGLKARLRVKVGEQVVTGQLLFEDKAAGGVRYTSPAAGTVADIHRGDRRALLSVVIRLAEDKDDIPEVAYDAYRGKPAEQLASEEVRELLLESGLWTAFRMRPYDKIPPTAENPYSIFVTAIDSHPLAPDPRLVLEESGEFFHAGLTDLSRLVPDGRVYLCRSPGGSLPGEKQPGIIVREFQGLHPCGTAGLHIHLAEPVSRSRRSWYIGYQDVVSLGSLVLTGHTHNERVLSLAGPSLNPPRLVRTIAGASLDDLVLDECAQGENRIVSGSVLGGRKAMGEIFGYLGRYHNQITVIPESEGRELFGWLAPGIDRFSVLRIFLSRLFPSRSPRFTSDVHGGERVMIPLPVYQKIFPFDMMPVHLLRALLSGDDEAAEDLGCLELGPEDLALCAFVCPSKIDYPALLRAALDRIEEAG